MGKWVRVRPRVPFGHESAERYIDKKARTFRIRLTLPLLLLPRALDRPFAQRVRTELGHLPGLVPIILFVAHPVTVSQHLPCYQLWEGKKPSHEPAERAPRHT